MEFDFNSNNNSQKESNALVRPEVYDPFDLALKQPSVTPLNLSVEGRQKIHSSIIKLILLGVLIGLAAGLLFLNVPGIRYRVMEMLNGGEINYSNGLATAFCLIWGAIVGGLFGALDYVLYSHLYNTLPAYAMLLFIPTIFFLLTVPLMLLTQLLFFVVKAVVIIILVIIGIFVAISFFS